MHNQCGNRLLFTHSLKRRLVQHLVWQYFCRYLVRILRLRYQWLKPVEQQVVRLPFPFSHSNRVPIIALAVARGKLMTVSTSRHRPRRGGAGWQQRPSPCGTPRAERGRLGPRGEQERGRRQTPAKMVSIDMALYDRSLSRCNFL